MISRKTHMYLLLHSCPINVLTSGCKRKISFLRNAWGSSETSQKKSVRDCWFTPTAWGMTFLYKTVKMSQGIPTLPLEIWDLILKHRACITLQTAIRRHMVSRLHYGHVHHAKWILLRKLLCKHGVLWRMYPFPLVRREWRTEIESWLPSTSISELLKDIEECKHWGLPSKTLQFTRDDRDRENSQPYFVPKCQ